MTTSKRFGLQGVGSDVQFGKAGPRAIVSGANVDVRDETNSVYVNVRGADAVIDDDLVTLRQLQNQLNGLRWLEPARAATTAALDANTRTGDVLTANGNGALPVQDGISLTVGQDLLVKDEGTPANNGVYGVTDPGSAGTPWVLTRRADMANGSNAINSALFVSEGSTQKDTAWVQTDDAGIVNTDPLTFTQFASVVSGVTSIASVGTGTSLVAGGAAPVPTIRSITTDGSLVASNNATETDLSIATGGVTTLKIADLAVTTAKIADLAVTTAKLADTSVTTAKLVDNSVTIDKVAPLAGVHFLRGTVNAGDGTVVIGSVPDNSLVLETRVDVTQAWGGALFTTQPTFQVGISGTPSLLQAVSEVDSETADLYVVDNDEVFASSTAIEAAEFADPAAPQGIAVVTVKFLTTA